MHMAWTAVHEVKDFLEDRIVICVMYEGTRVVMSESRYPKDPPGYSYRERFLKKKTRWGWLPWRKRWTRSFVWSGPLDE